MEDFELLATLQHFGDKTNLIDFTTDYLVALFFACDGEPEEPGRVILLQKQSEAYKVEKPPRTIRRAETQKSIFVQAPKGFVKPNKVVSVPADLKSALLDHLRKHHDISTKTIYNDLQGFIENRGLHRSAYTEFYEGLTCQERGNSAKTQVEKQKWYDAAIIHYTEAVRLNADLVTAYNNRGNAYGDKGEVDRAIQDFNKAIDLNPEYATAYNNRGNAYGDKGEVDRAIQDYNKAIDLNSEDATAYNNRGSACR
jgi:tetratricopeptide (TPR) repeat protein